MEKINNYILKLRKNSKVNFIYNLYIIIITFLTTFITLNNIIQKTYVTNNFLLYIIDTIALITFYVDYFGGLKYSLDKEYFKKTHKLEIIALIPFNEIIFIITLLNKNNLTIITNLLVILNFLKIFKILAVYTIMKESLDDFFTTNGFFYSLFFTCFTILIGSVLIYAVEKGKTIETFGDAIWWTFVTTTTVGYGDIYPSSTIGRIIACVLMLIGIGILSMLTCTISTYFLSKKFNKEKKLKKEENIIKDKKLSDLNGEDLDLSDLTDEQYAMIITFIKYMKDQNKKRP